MSPTEHDLRAALSDGEGDGPDAGRLIALGEAQRARRRMQALSTAAAVVLIAGAGTGIVALARGGGGDDKTSADSAAGQRYDSNSGTAAAGGAARLPAVPSATGGASTNAEKSADAAVRCPATVPRYALPGGGSPGQFGSDGPLFSKPVQSVVVCSYRAADAPGAQPASTLPARAAVTGAKAARLAASLNAAAATPGASCPQTDLPAVSDLAIIGLAADGTSAGTVTATYQPAGCSARVTNGTAVRYNWTPPSELVPVLARLSPRSAVVPTQMPTGKVHGSPISS
jgi:hypothetical protein